MELDNADFMDIDNLARQDREQERRIAGPGSLNSLRASHMLSRLGLAAASHEEAEAALRENWPEGWRTDEQGERFGDEWFGFLATDALKYHALRKLACQRRSR